MRLERCSVLNALNDGKWDEKTPNCALSLVILALPWLYRTQVLESTLFFKNQYISFEAGCS